MTLHHPLYHRIFDRRLEPGMCVSARPRPLIHCLSIDNKRTMSAKSEVHRYSSIDAPPTTISCR
jgi:hypothetical protein